MDTVNKDRAPEVLGVTIFLSALGGVFVFARTITRAILKPNFGWDDALIIITWFLYLGFCVSLCIATAHGYGKPMATLAPEQVVPTLRILTVSQFLAVITYPTGKASIAYLLIRIFPGRTLKWILWTFVAGNAIFFYLNGVFIFIECRPVEYNWDRLGTTGSCWNPKVMRDWGWITGIFGVVTDFVFATLPWYYIRKLQMRTREKIGVGIALSMGLLATVCCIVKIDLTLGFWTITDVTYDTVPLVLWGCAEMGLINIAACIPTLRPFYLLLTGKNPRDGSARTSAAYLVKHSTSSESSQRSASTSQHSTGSIEPKSSSGNDFHIYQERSFEVAYQDRDMEQLKNFDTTRSHELFKRDK